MRSTRMDSVPVRVRPVVVILLTLCLSFASGASAQSTDTPAFPANAWTAIAHGKLADAEAAAKGATGPDAAAVLAHLAVRTGDYLRAVALLEPVVAEAPISTAAVELGILHLRLGRTEAGTGLLTPIYRQGSSADTPEAVALAARAAQALGRAQEANSLYRAASSAKGGDPVIDTAWGQLFLEKYNEAEALRSFQQVLKRDALWAPAHAGMGWALADDNPPAAAAAGTRALEIDPGLDSAELLLAQLELDNSRPAAARTRLDRVLAQNPNHLDGRALLAAMAHVSGDRAAFDREVRAVLAINPAFGEVYRATADLAARNYRFDEAVALARQAIALDPTSARAHAELGMHLLRTGDEAEARKALERSFASDRFNRITYNLLLLLDKLDGFTVVRDGDVTLKMHPDEAPVLREYAMPLAKEALDALGKRYRFTPKGPILIEIFPVHDDFAVRNLGLPGLIGALGACFGRVVTMDSPKARPPGEFSWQATLWHELAHVITLQMSGQRVPRWLTEGISVYEEGRARPEWGRDMEVPFALALNQGKTLKLTDLNAGFTNPETIAIAYFQASLLVDHIVKTFGEDTLIALLQSYGDGREADAALTTTLGASMEQLQVSFDKAVDARFAPLRAALKPVQGLDKGADLETLRTAYASHPQSYQAALAYGRTLASAKSAGAFEALERAATLVPMATGEESPRAIMAGLAEQLGDPARALKEYEALLAHDHTALEPARRMAALAEKLANPDAAGIAYERVVGLDPSDAAAHSGWGRLAMKKKRTDIAVREFRAALAVEPADRAAAHCDLGEALLALGQRDEAKREALAALEIAPSFERAQDLLLGVIDFKVEPRR